MFLQAVQVVRIQVVAVGIHILVEAVASKGLTEVVGREQAVVEAARRAVRMAVVVPVEAHLAVVDNHSSVVLKALLVAD